MSIPLDRLYHYIDSVAREINNDNIVIYRFYPHGSKKAEDCCTLTDLSWAEKVSNIHMYCNDQEPLNYELYENLSSNKDFTNLLKSLSLYNPQNLRRYASIYEKSYLLHSEQRSDEVIKYQNLCFIPVYYWSHAIIARDWFRYAKYTNQHKRIQKIFLIYSRAWSGTREYRLKFAEFLIRLGIDNCCRMRINSIEPELGIHYDQHQFINPAWKPTQVLEDFFPTNNAPSHYSADFDIEDYEATDIEVVLETLFDDGRLHLTEKSIRPIACAQPFILAGTHGSLDYLHSYGFKTFSDIWDESYDSIEDPKQRLYAITDLMKQIANWSPEKRFNKMLAAQAIADHNKKHFFSQKFFNQVTAELKTNLQLSASCLETTNSFKTFIDCWEHRLSIKELKDFLENNHSKYVPNLDQINTALKIAKNLQ